MMNRRNGKLKSCEPCRKSKIKCDHSIPNCEKCRSRGLLDQCFYHPAPMTRSHGEVRSIKASRGLKHWERSISNNEVPHTAHTNDLDSAQTSQSQSSALMYGEFNAWASQEPSGLAASGGLSEVLSSRAGALLPGRERAQPDQFQLESGSKIIALLHPFSVFEDLIRYFCLMSQVFAVGSPLVLGALPYVKAVLEAESDPGPSVKNDVLSRKITENTLRPLLIPESTTAAKFHMLFTGQNLRWEFLGFLFAIAGRSAMVRAPNASPLTGENEDDIDRTKFIYDVMKASRTCVALCRQDGAVVNDLLIWLLYENLLFSTMHYGDSSPLVWQRLGDLSTDIFAMGLHKEPQDPTEVPFFLQECRRRVFAAAYRSDKTLCTFLGRPPRIPQLYCDMKPPLDISDENLMLEGPALEAVLSNLDRDGWNRDRAIKPASFMRLRYIMSSFREEILEISLGSESVDMIHKLNNISQRCQQAWHDVPAHLHYNSACWDSGQSLGTCLMLLANYLDKLHSDFHIQRLLCKFSSAGNHALLGTSMQMLTSAMVVVKQHVIQYEMQGDYAWLILFYGVSSAGVLAAELSRSTRTGVPLPPSIHRPELIRYLSVLISYLEWVTRPGDGNYTACSEASKMLGRILDEALDTQAAPGNDGEQGVVPEPAADGTVPDAADDDMLLDSNGHGNEALPLDSEAFLDWFDSVDWNNPMGF